MSGHTQYLLSQAFPETEWSPVGDLWAHSELILTDAYTAKGIVVGKVIGPNGVSDEFRAAFRSGPEKWEWTPGPLSARPEEAVSKALLIWQKAGGVASAWSFDPDLEDGSNLLISLIRAGRFSEETLLTMYRQRDLDPVVKDYLEERLGIRGYFRWLFGGPGRHEVWTHAGYVGELKTSFALNWAYHGYVTHRRNVCLVSSELSDLPNRMVNLHSMHPKFEKLRKEAGLPPSNTGSKEEAKFLREHVGKDFHSHQYGRLLYGPAPGHLTSRVFEGLRELIEFSERPCLLIIDDPEFGFAQIPDYIESKDVGIIRTVAISRKHWEQAQSDSRYDLAGFRWGNITTSDLVTTSWYGRGYRGRGRTLVQCLKNRHFDTFELEMGFNAASGRLLPVSQPDP